MPRDALRDLFGPSGIHDVVAMRIPIMQFTVGYKLNGSAHHIKVEAEDALMAALKVKMQHGEAKVMYVRPQNRRGDLRHPALNLSDQFATLHRGQDRV